VIVDRISKFSRHPPNTGLDHLKIPKKKKEKEIRLMQMGHIVQKKITIEKFCC
jgi:hypothetical protein